MIDPLRFAGWVSGEARNALAAAPAPPPPDADLGELRRHYDAYNRRMLARARSTFDVAVEAREVNGVPVHVVTPVSGLRTDWHLICLHGGAFMWGAGAGALLEAVPVAAVAGCTVIVPEYRLAPEHRYPGAVEDVLAVYAALLSERASSTVGIYGCSAGAVLAAQATARLILDSAPLPGALVMLHGSGVEFDGDSAMTAPALDPRAGAGEAPKASDLPYFADADLSDPAVLPGNHADVIAQFPPSLLISATRDFAASGCSVMHRRLLAAGAEAQFVLFDGLGHAHHMDVALPESRETFELIAGFFARHLG